VTFSENIIDCLVIGGGLVGGSLAYGMARLGSEVTVLDEGDVAFRASRGNFGLIWVQGKGDGMSAYARWTRTSAAGWPDFAKELSEQTGVDLELKQNGGYWFGFTEEEVAARSAMLAQLRDDAGVSFQMLDGHEIRARLDVVGPRVVGASFCPHDGHVNPLRLLRALHLGMEKYRVNVRNAAPVEAIEFTDGTFIVKTGRDTVRARRVVLAAGLGNAKLGPLVGLRAPVRANRGQILVTERLKPFLPFATNKARQTSEGTVQLGSTEEDVGLDDTTTMEGMRGLAGRAVMTFPLLARARLVRAWGALRVMTPDSFPIYEESSTCPGAFLVTCHSGVTLSAAHAMSVAPWIAGYGAMPAGIKAFSASRFGDSAGAPRHA
jgi:glycine/D-amino acid oxidase-like deaminating enzyme